MDEWMQKWQEGIDSIDEVSVALERHKHRLAVMEERLERLDALLSK